MRAALPVVWAVPFFFDATKPRPWSDTDAAYQSLDVCGYNYTKDHYESDHLLHPSRVMMGTESFPVQVAENWELVNKQIVGPSRGQKRWKQGCRGILDRPNSSRWCTL